MFLRHKIYYFFFKLLAKILIKSKPIPNNPIQELNLNKNCSFLYILPYNSKINLFILRQQCYCLGLPDPLKLIEIKKQKFPAYIFIDDNLYPYNYKSPSINQNSIKIFNKYLHTHFYDKKSNIQILLVSIIFNRSPGKKSQIPTSYSKLLNNIKLLFTIILSGRNIFIRFSSQISLKKIANKYFKNKNIINKLAYIARLYYSRQQYAAIGPQLPLRYELFNKLLNSEYIKKIITNESKIKKISINAAKQNAYYIIKEIAADFSYTIVNFTDHILGWILNKLYQNINVKHAKNVRKLAQRGYKIIYIPSHRSHMDYLLLSYVLYHQGLFLPHIIAGNNLNFWPAGIIFRHLGAFFIRRSFGTNKLYSAIFREYLNELFIRGYSIEYFIEGGRSRTGRLLKPKTGILSMTLQTILNNNINKISIIPIYIGYEHILEITNYIKELKGIKKTTEGLFLMLKGISKLRKLGQSYINFGQPIILSNYLNNKIPEWNKSIKIINTTQQRPLWLNLIITKLANNIMIEINNAAAVNSINLCSAVLLTSKKQTLAKESLIKQIQCYLKLLQNIPYSSYITIPNETAEELLNYALKFKKIKIKKNNTENIIYIPSKNIIFMTYYRNNIIHLLILPSLIATIILHNKDINLNIINNQTKLIYPFIKAELFMKYNIKELKNIINIIINEFINQKLILSINNNIIVNQLYIQSLQLLSSIIKEILQRYAITFSLLNTNDMFSKHDLEKKSFLLAQQMCIKNDIYNHDLFDKTIFTILINTLKQEGYINIIDNYIIKYNIRKLYTLILNLISF